MLLKVSLESCPIRTQRAAVGPLPRVHPDVPLEVLALAEDLEAEIAVVVLGGGSPAGRGGPSLVASIQDEGDSRGLVHLRRSGPVVTC